MIPCIEDIAGMLERGECTTEQALKWYAIHAERIGMGEGEMIRSCISCKRHEGECNIMCITDHPDYSDGDYCEDCNPYERDRKRKQSDPHCNRCALLAHENEKLRAEADERERKAFLAGFKISGEGGNGEHPCEDWDDGKIWERIQGEFDLYKKARGE